MPITLRSGIDLVEINRLVSLNPAIRARFLARVFNSAELIDAVDRWDTLSGRFAAKEAVAKALGCGIGQVAWKDIEIQRGKQGEPELKLHGKAAQMAEKMGLDSWSISISHTRTHAVAVAVAVASCGAIDNSSGLEQP